MYFIMNDYLQKQKFAMSDWKGEPAYRTGDGFVEGYKYLKWSYGNGHFHLEAWIKGSFGGEMGLEGFMGCLVKKPYRESLEQLVQVLQQPLPQGVQSAPWRKRSDGAYGGNRQSNARGGRKQRSNGKCRRSCGPDSGRRKPDAGSRAPCHSRTDSGPFQRCADGTGAWNCSDCNRAVSSSVWHYLWLHRFFQSKNGAWFIERQSGESRKGLQHCRNLYVSRYLVFKYTAQRIFVFVREFSP